jgi:hypothetical protein
MYTRSPYAKCQFLEKRFYHQACFIVVQHSATNSDLQNKHSISILNQSSLGQSCMKCMCNVFVSIFYLIGLNVECQNNIRSEPGRNSLS